MPSYGFDPRLGMLSDWKAVIDVLHPSGHFGFIEGVYARYRRHPRNVTKLDQRDHAIRVFAEVLSLLAIVEAEYPSLMSASRRTRARQQLYHAKRCWDWGDRRAARQYMAAAVRECPSGVGAWLARRALGGPMGRPA